MNFKHADGTYIGYYEIQTASAAKNIHIRTGCHGNPGACRKYLKEDEGVLKESWFFDYMINRLSLEKDSCSDSIDMVTGRPVGGSNSLLLMHHFIVRISLGYLTTFNDIMTFVDFVKEYIDA